MKFHILLGCLVVVLAMTLQSNCHFLKHKETEVKHTEAQWPGGEWRSVKSEWKARWVREWEEKKVYVPVWKKVWGPVEIREWVPFPRPPPGWGPAKDQQEHYDNLEPKHEPDHSFQSSEMEPDKLHPVYLPANDNPTLEVLQQPENAFENTNVPQEHQYSAESAPQQNTELPK